MLNCFKIYYYLQMIKNVCGEHHRNQTKKGTEKRINGMSSKIFHKAQQLYFISYQKSSKMNTYICKSMHIHMYA